MQPSHYSSGAPCIKFSPSPSADSATKITIAYARAHPWLLSLCGTILQLPGWTRISSGPGELIALRGPDNIQLSLPSTAAAFFDAETAGHWQVMFDTPEFAEVCAASPAVADVISVVQYLCQGLLLVGGENMPSKEWMDEHAADLRRVGGMAPPGTAGKFA